MKDSLDNGSPADEPASTSRSAMEKRIVELTEAIAARDAFLAVAAHELRNPMTPILAQVQRLNRMSASGSDRAEIAKGLGRLEKLVEQYIRRATALLEVSRMTTGKRCLTPERFDLAEQVRDAVEAVRPAADYVGSTITVLAPAHVPVFLDRLAIEQILDNLISNAVKYGAGRPITLSLEVAADQATIAVEDRGMGISPVDQARIFDRFERAVSQGSAIGGFGVGLWVVGQLTEAMGANIQIDSRVGQGTTFTVRLPLQIGRSK
ncbi:sensor histidine kinase [Microvirga brassicacearum]|uniref:sensor histidine kinase n=1 Tax=Microvirga brassicacearum TaxID=2580413 RepID=UPI001911A696|nr:HAMP domain-containing sensor histidine kinase [Microvirga brassicacearum]